MNDVQIKAAGAKAFVDAVKSRDVAEALRKLTTQDLYCLSEYLKQLGHCEGVPGMVTVLVRSEKAVRFDAEAKKALETLAPIGNTVAERGEQF